MYNANEYASPGRMNGVATNSKFMEEALSLLHLVAEDEEFMMQLAYGKEGRDYTIDEDGYYHMVTREDGSNYSMSHLALLSGFTDIVAKNSNSFTNPGVYHDRDIVYEGKTILESHQQMWDEAEKRYLIVFDYTGFDAERAAIEQVCKKYFTGYSTMTPEKYDKMIADFNAAGADRILASLQKQYDQWKKDNPDKVR